MQIIPVVLTDYNTRHGTHYQPEHLFDPAINIAIGCELLRVIITIHARERAARSIAARAGLLRSARPGATDGRRHGGSLMAPTS